LARSSPHGHGAPARPSKSARLGSRTDDGVAALLDALDLIIRELQCSDPRYSNRSDRFTVS
jgi:hypothetical protein